MLPKEIEIEMLKYSDEQVQTMTFEEISSWLSDVSKEEGNFYLKRYEKLEFFEVCALIKRYYDVNL